MKKFVAISLSLVMFLSLSTAISVSAASPKEYVVESVENRGAIIHVNSEQVFCTERNVAHPEAGVVYTAIDKKCPDDLLKVVVAAKLYGKNNVLDNTAAGIAVWTITDNSSVYIGKAYNPDKSKFSNNDIVNRTLEILDAASNVKLEQYNVAYQYMVAEGYQTLLMVKVEKKTPSTTTTTKKPTTTTAANTTTTTTTTVAPTQTQTSTSQTEATTTQSQTTTTQSQTTTTQSATSTAPTEETSSTTTAPTEETNSTTTTAPTMNVLDTPTEEFPEDEPDTPPTPEDEPEDEPKEEPKEYPTSPKTGDNMLLKKVTSNIGWAIAIIIALLGIFVASAVLKKSK